MFVKPKQGVQVLDPHTLRPIHAEGVEVPETAYWMRRLRDGDLELSAAPEAAAPAHAESSQPETHA